MKNNLLCIIALGLLGCSEDGYVLSICADGQWQDVQCMTVSPDAYTP